MSRLVIVGTDRVLDRAAFNELTQTAARRLLTSWWATAVEPVWDRLVAEGISVQGLLDAQRPGMQAMVVTFLCDCGLLQQLTADDDESDEEIAARAAQLRGEVAS